LSGYCADAEPVPANNNAAKSNPKKLFMIYPFSCQPNEIGFWS